MYAGGRDCDLFSCVLARVAVVVVHLGSGGSVAVLLRSAVAFLRSGGCSFNLGRLCGGAGSGGFQVFRALDTGGQ